MKNKQWFSKGIKVGIMAAVGLLGLPQTSHTSLDLAGHNVMISAPGFNLNAANLDNFRIHFNINDFVPVQTVNRDPLTVPSKEGTKQFQNKIASVATLPRNDKGISERLAVRVDVRDGFVTLSETRTILCEGQISQGSGKTSITTTHAAEPGANASVLLTLMEV